MSYVKSWFKIKEFSRRRLIGSGIAAVVVAILSLFIHQVDFLSALGWGTATLAALLFPIEFTDKMPYICRTAILCGITALMFVLMQHTISCGIHNLSPLLLFINIAILYGITSIVWLFTTSMKASIVAVAILTYVIAVVDHIVVQSRSFEIQFSDIASIGTAMQVAGNYKVDLYWETREGIMIGLILVGFVFATRFPRNKLNFKHILYTVAPTALAFVCGFIVFNQAFSDTIGITDKYWKYRGSELNGFFVNMIYSASATRIVEPDGYQVGSDSQTEGTLEAVLKKEPVVNTDKNEGEDNKVVTDGEEKKPHVIVIMNETFSDVHNISSYLGYGMNTNVPVMPFFDSLSDAESNIVKGHVIASVYGGNTANSEFEFLTGLSMAFLPRSTVAYNFYLNEANTFSIVDCFESAGYKTVAMHPEDRTNWKRDTIYDYYGFDETYFRDNFGDLSEEEDWFRSYVSDKAVYDKIIECYESSVANGESLFTFAVTMQNHGGYTTEGMEYTVELTDQNKPKVNEYLTAINNSDKALQYLINYFEQQDEEVIICFYGDHQPSISYIGSGFFGLTDESSEAERLAQYITPYLYWSNSDIEEDVNDVTSINFLSGHLLEMCGVERTDFLEFVYQMSGEITALSAAGYVSNEMEFTPLSYGQVDLPYHLQLYSSLQYNALFDTENKLTGLFSTIDPADLSAVETEPSVETTVDENVPEGEVAYAHGNN